MGEIPSGPTGDGGYFFILKKDDDGGNIDMCGNK